MTIPEIATYAGVVPKTVYTMFANGLPYSTVNGLPNGHRRVRKEDLDDFMAGKFTTLAVAA
jgi:excisionase family DNA binding protein